MNDKEFTAAYVEFQKSLHSMVREARLPAIVKLSIIRELEMGLGRYVQALTSEKREEEKTDGQDGDA